MTFRFCCLVSRACTFIQWKQYWFTQTCLLLLHRDWLESLSSNSRQVWVRDWLESLSINSGQVWDSTAKKRILWCALYYLQISRLLSQHLNTSSNKEATKILTCALNSSCWTWPRMYRPPWQKRKRNKWNDTVKEKWISNQYFQIFCSEKCFISKVRTIK